MRGDHASNRYILLTWPVGQAALTWYVRPGGDDNDDGQSALTAFATLGRALREVPLYAANRPSIIDVTGMTIAEAELLQLGGAALGGIIGTADAVPAPPLVPGRRQVQIVATPTVVQALNVTSDATNPTSGLVTLTVSDAIAPGALDNLIVGGAGAGELAAIKSYTTGAGPNTIEIDATSAPSAPVRAYAPGASLTYGDPAQALDGAIHLHALADWSFQWIAFASTAGAKPCALTIWPDAPVQLIGCVLDGLQIMAGGGAVHLYASVVKDASLVLDGANVLLERTALRSLTALDCNGSSAAGATTLTQSSVQGCPPWGGGISTSRFACAVTNSEVLDGVGNGIDCRFGVWTISDALVATCGGSGIYVQDASVSINSVGGAGNVGYGLRAAWFCNVNADATVTGTLGDVSLGDAGVFAWAELPATDLERLARVFYSGGV